MADQESNQAMDGASASGGRPVTLENPFRSIGSVSRSPPALSAKGVSPLAPKDRAATVEPGADPFKVSSNLSRSPPKVVEVEPAPGQPKKLNAAESILVESTPTEHQNETDAKSAKNTMAKELQKCKDIVKRMKSATDRQRNISMDVKKGLAELQESLDIISWLRKIWDTDPQSLQVDEPSQEFPQATRSTNRETERREARERTAMVDPEAKKKRPPSSPLAKESEKRKKETPSNASSEPPKPALSRKDIPQREAKVPAADSVQQSKPRLKEKKPEKGPNGDPAKQTTPSRKKKDDSGSASWQETRRKKRLPKPKPEAILIKTRGTETYAEILREIRCKANPDDTETTIQTIRQTRSGDVLVEFAEKSKGKEGFSASLKAILGEKAKIRHLEPMTTIEIRDMDELTTEDEVEAAVKREANDPAIDLQVTLSKSNKRAQRMALVQLNTRVANELLRAPRIKIGWVHCRVRKRVVVTRCFKCFGYGHKQTTCSGPNRMSQGLCFNCGEQGHQRIDCKKSAKCCLCTELNLAPALLAHVPGSGKCRVFQEALAKEKKNNAQ